MKTKILEFIFGFFLNVILWLIWFFAVLFYLFFLIVGFVLSSLDKLKVIID